MKIDSLMYPDKEVIKDHVKLMAYIDNHSSSHNYHRIKSLEAYKTANTQGEGYHALQQSKPDNLKTLYSITENNLDKQTLAKGVKKDDSADKRWLNQVVIGEGTTILKY